MNKKLAGKNIRDNKDKIIKMFQSNIRIADIANEYNVVENTIYVYLKKWGISIMPGTYQRRKTYQKMEKERKKYRQDLSPELLLRREENNVVNRKYVKHYKFKNSPEDQRLINNIIEHPIIG